MIGGVGVLWLVAAAPVGVARAGLRRAVRLGYSVTAFVVPAMMSDRFRGPNFGAIFGATQVASALGSALGAWMAGRIFDATGSYAIAFSIAAGAAAVAALSVWASRVPQRGRQESARGSRRDRRRTRPSRRSACRSGRERSRATADRAGDGTVRRSAPDGRGDLGRWARAPGPGCILLGARSAARAAAEHRGRGLGGGDRRPDRDCRRDRAGARGTAATRGRRCRPRPGPGRPAPSRPRASLARGSRAPPPCRRRGRRASAGRPGVSATSARSSASLGLEAREPRRQVGRTLPREATAPRESCAPVSPWHLRIEQELRQWPMTEKSAGYRSDRPAASAHARHPGVAP